MAVGGLNPSAKHLRVESPGPTEASSDDGERLGQVAAQPMLTEIAMAQHTNEVIMDLEPIIFGASEEEMTLPQAVEGEMAPLQSAGKPWEKLRPSAFKNQWSRRWHRWWES